MKATDLFTTAILDDRAASDRDTAFRSVLEILAHRGAIPADQVGRLHDGLVRREELGSTGLGGGLGVPKTRCLALTSAVGVLALCRTPIEYHALDGEPVDLIALIVAPPEVPGMSLGAAGRATPAGRYLMDIFWRRMRDSRFLADLRGCATAEELARVLDEADRPMDWDRNP